MLSFKMDGIVLTSSVIKWTSSLLYISVLQVLCINRFGSASAGGSFSYEINTPSPSGDLDVILKSTYEPDSGTIDVIWDYSTTSSIAISWSLHSKHINGSIYSSQVECYLQHGKFKSRFLEPEYTSFVFVNLNIESTYRICLTIYETVPSGLSSDTITHLKCLKLSTIPFIRKDSVLAVLLSLGYFAFVTLLGYVHWYRRASLIRARKRRNQERRSRSEPTTPVVRWREVEERQRLCLPSSIEDVAPQDL